MRLTVAYLEAGHSTGSGRNGSVSRTNLCSRGQVGCDVAKHPLSMRARQLRRLVSAMVRRHSHGSRGSPGIDVVAPVVEVKHFLVSGQCSR